MTAPNRDKPVADLHVDRRARLGLYADRMLSVIDERVAAIVIALHVLALWAFGSVMWVDASTYIRLAQAFTSVDAMRAVYDGSSLWWHNYVPPGVPLIWSAASALPVDAIWPVVAIVQHAIAAAALVSAVSAARVFALSRKYAIAAVLLCVYPFYQAFHNSLGTESLASSLLLCSFSVLLRALKDESWSSARFAQLLALAAAASLFRHSVVLMIVGFAAVAALHHRRLIGGPIIAAALVTAGSLYWYAVVRTPVTGEFIPPRPGLSSLHMAPRVNLDPSPAARRAIETVDWPTGLTADAILTGKVDYAQFEQVAKAWRAQGLANGDVLDRFEALGKSLRHDGWRTEARAVAHGLVAAGIAAPCLMASSQETYTRGMTNAAACESNTAWTKVFAWMAVDRGLVERLFAGSFQDVSVPDLRLFEKAWMAWYKDGPKRLRDPLFLDYINVTMLTSAFLAGAVLICRRHALLGLCLLGLPGVMVYLHAMVPFGGTRYAYPLIPVYVIAIPLASALMHGAPPVAFWPSLSKLVRENLKSSERQAD